MDGANGTEPNASPAFFIDPNECDACFHQPFYVPTTFLKRHQHSHDDAVRWRVRDVTGAGLKLLMLAYLRLHRCHT